MLILPCNGLYQSLNEKTQKMLPYLIQQNWLMSYRTIEGIASILEKMDHRMKRNSIMRQSVNELRLFYTEFEVEFSQFFKELQVYSKSKIETL